MDLLQQLNKIAAEKQLALRGVNPNAPLSIACFVLLNRNNEVVLDGDDLAAGLSDLTRISELAGTADPGDAAQATLSTNLTGANNDLVFTAIAVGEDGNQITIAYLDPGANDQELAIDITGNAIEISLATGVAGAITTIGDDIAALDFGGLVTAANKAANDGSGVVTAMAAAPLAGGANATGDGTAATGSRYTNTTDGTLWINTGTAEAPVWAQLATVP